MTFALSIGLGFAASIALLAIGLQRVPRRSRCPKCGRKTEAVLPPPWLKPGQKWLSMRWCAVCSWEGVGRKGPPIVPGRRAAHDSGFHWGADVAPPNAGFEWAPLREVPPAAEPPHHPSGFRFGGQPEEPGRHAHPSGFSWRNEAQGRSTTAHRSGFAWRGGTPPGSPARETNREGKDEPRSDEPGFRWGDAERPQRSFRWKQRP